MRFSKNVCEGIEFVGSSVECIVLDRDAKVREVVFDEVSVPTKLFDEARSENIYAPGHIRSRLLAVGCAFKEAVGGQMEEWPRDQQVQNFFKIVRLFSRSSFITENVMRMKFGTEWSSVEKELILPLKHNGFIEMPSPRQGNVQGFKLRCPMKAILIAEKQCPTSVEELIRTLRAGVSR